MLVFDRMTSHMCKVEVIQASAMDPAGLEAPMMLSSCRLEEN